VPDASETTEVTETEVTETTNTATDDTEDATEGTDDQEAETFPRDYVEKLRKESAGYRDRAKTAEARADELARRLHTALVSATGKLADATDLEFNADHLDDATALAEAIDALIAGKPHLKARRLSGDVGQGIKGDNSGRFSLLQRLKQTV
jgi:hypothetical protein